jgi:hypothetical protein
MRDVRACAWEMATDGCSGWCHVAHLTRAACLGLALALAAAPCRADDVTFDIKNVDASVAQKFKKEFLAKKEKVESYLTTKSFAPLFSGKFDVEVSNGQAFSEALLFAWAGRRGHMFFPAPRAKEGRTAIVHEVTHVHAPNEVRFLAEGFPAVLEEQMGNLKAYPTLGKHVECDIVDYNDAYKQAVRSVKFSLFDGVATQKGVFLGDNMGLEKAFPASDDGTSQRRAFAYLVSASFVKFLIEKHGLDDFKALYNLTPLTPGRATPADPARYQQVFSGKSLDELQADWRQWLKDKQKSCS